MRVGHFFAVFPHSKISVPGLVEAEGPWLPGRLFLTSECGISEGHIAQVPKIQPAAINTSYGWRGGGAIRGIPLLTVAASAQNGGLVWELTGRGLKMDEQ